MGKRTTLAELQAKKRATGRTTRLIAKAVELAAQGRAVYVIARQYRDLQAVIDATYPDSGIKCEPCLPGGWQWSQMRVLGSHPNCVWLIDPFVVESDETFIQMFNAMTAFDQE